MPEGPQGQKRPANVIGGAVQMARLSVGGINEAIKARSGRTRNGALGGIARAQKPSHQERQEVARKDAQRRWGVSDV